MSFSNKLPAVPRWLQPADKPFCQCVIAMELISDNLQDFDNWYIIEKANNIKANEGI
jgi:hypothetical protein